MTNNIASIRKSKGYTQTQLAKDAKISRPYLSNVENDKVEPTAKIMFRIAKVLNEKIEVIFFDSDVSQGKQKGA